MRFVDRLEDRLPQPLLPLGCEQGLLQKLPPLLALRDQQRPDHVLPHPADLMIVGQRLTEDLEDLLALRPVGIDRRRQHGPDTCLAVGEGVRRPLGQPFQADGVGVERLQSPHQLRQPPGAVTQRQEGILGGAEGLAVVADLIRAFFEELPARVNPVGDSRRQRPEQSDPVFVRQRLDVDRNLTLFDLGSLPLMVSETLPLPVAADETVADDSESLGQGRHGAEETLPLALVVESPRCQSLSRHVGFQHASPPAVAQPPDSSVKRMNTSRLSSWT